MRTKLTLKQESFVNEYVESKGNGTQSALKVYDTDDYDTAAAIGYENLNKPQIALAIDQRIADVKEFFTAKAADAAQVLESLMHEADEDKVRLGAVKDLLDRAGLKPTEKSVNISLNKAINFDI